jgi:RES domain-containing protein
VITSWRIVKARYAATAVDGEGARLYGGRWNARGVPMVYTADSAALAALEMLAHLGRGMVLPSYVVMGCTFDERIVLRLDRARLAADWRAYPPPPHLSAIGDAWARSGASAVLEVPNTIIPAASTYLLNPRHPRFPDVAIGAPVAFEFDLRLVGT